jgi:hypothetical protein
MTYNYNYINYNYSYMTFNYNYTTPFYSNEIMIFTAVGK